MLEDANGAEVLDFRDVSLERDRSYVAIRLGLGFHQDYRDHKLYSLHSEGAASWAPAGSAAASGESGSVECAGSGTVGDDSADKASEEAANTECGSAETAEVGHSMRPVAERVVNTDVVNDFPQHLVFYEIRKPEDADGEQLDGSATGRLCGSFSLMFSLLVVVVSLVF